MALSDLTPGKLAKYKLTLLAALVLASLLLEIAVHWYLGIDVIYSHFFYIPVVLGAIWYGKRGVVVAIVLGAALLVGTWITRGAIDTGALLRALMFIIVGLVIGIISDFMKKEQEEIINEVTDAALRSAEKGRSSTDNRTEARVRILSFASVKRLKEQGDVPGLIRALRNRDPAVQYEAVEALGELANPAATEALMGALTGDQYSGIRWKAAEALARIGPPAVEPLIRALGHPDEDVRWKAAVTLGEIGDARGIVPLTGLLSDEDRFVRSRAAYALGLIGPPAIPALSAALPTGPVCVKRGIVGALGKIRDPDAVSILVQTLADPSPEVREDTIAALAEEGEFATPFLITALNDPEPIRRQGAALILGSGGRKEALGPLKEALPAADPQTAEVFREAIREILASRGPAPQDAPGRGSEI